MIKVVMFEADDGRLFRTEKECQDHEIGMLVRKKLVQMISEDDKLDVDCASDITNFIIKNYEDIAYLFSNARNILSR